MKRRKLTLLLCVSLFIGSSSVVSFGADAVAPRIIASQQTFLSRLARRTLEDAIAGRGVYEPQYIPDSLATLRGECVIRVRQRGYLLSVGAGSAGLVASAVRDAAHSSAQSLPPETDRSPSESDDWLIEIEILGEPVAFSEGTDWSQEKVIRANFEPGVDGAIIMTQDRARRVCPSEFVAGGISVPEALERLAQSMQIGPDRIPKTPLLRFRSTHWYEPAKGSPVVSLSRGMSVVSVSAVSESGLSAAIDRLAEYMVYRRRSSGLFTYQFESGADLYSEDDNLVHQAGATLAMTVHARLSGQEATLKAADAALQIHLRGLTALPGHDAAAFIATADGRNKLGVTALISIALANHPRPEPYEATRRKLVQGMLALQAPTGMFVTAFPPATQLSGQDQFPGEALLALAADYDHAPSAEVLAAFDRAIEFYRDYFRSGRSAAFAPWQVQAFALMAKHTKRKDYQEFVFELSDWLAERQISEATSPWPELVGGVDAAGDGRVGAATAAYLEALVDALTLARTVGDKSRSARYEKAVITAARFVMQLQVRPEETYYARSPLDMVGGIRAAPAENRLRIDHCHHALVGLLKARKALFPSDG